MIRARGYYRQDRENERRHHDLGEFEGSRKRTVEHVSSNDVDESADHQAEEDRRGEPAHNLFYEMERRGGLPADRKSVVTGKGVSVRVDLGGRRSIKKKKKTTN